MVCATGSWLLTEPVLLQALVTVSAATAVTGAVLMRRWDRSAGRQVADLTRGRASDAWRAEERIAELENTAEEFREARTRLEAKLRAKRVELAGLRGEHAALLRRYATAETDRASVLEDRRQLEVDASPGANTIAKAGGGAPKALPAAGSTPTPARYLQAARALENLSRNAAGQRIGAPAAPVGAPGEPVRPGGRPGALPAARPAEPAARPAVTAGPAPAPALPKPADPGPGQPPRGGGAPAPADAPGASVPRPAAAPRPDSVPAPATAPKATPPVPPATASVHTTVPATPAAPATPAVPAAAPVTTAVATPVPSAQLPQPTPSADKAAGSAGPSGSSASAAAAAIVPYGPRRAGARPEGNFDFFGNHTGQVAVPERARTAIEAVQEEDLADVVGAEALAEQQAGAVARRKNGREPAAPKHARRTERKAAPGPARPPAPAAAEQTAPQPAPQDGPAADDTARGAAGDVIDLTAHDETEKLDLGELRNAVSS